MIVQVIIKNIAIHVIITFGVVIAPFIPILDANSEEVNLRRTKLPATLPKF